MGYFCLISWWPKNIIDFANQLLHQSLVILVQLKCEHVNLL